MLNFVGVKSQIDHHHPLSENHNFFRIKHLMDHRPVYKLECVHCGPTRKNLEHTIYLGLMWRSDEVQGHLFPNSKIERFAHFLTKLPIFEKILIRWILSIFITYLTPANPIP